MVQTLYTLYKKLQILVCKPRSINENYEQETISAENILLFLIRITVHYGHVNT